MRWHDKIKRQSKNRESLTPTAALGEPTHQPIRVKQVRSPIGHPKNQGATLKCMGLHKIGDEVELVDNPTHHGMIKTVQHLIRILE